MAERLRTPPVLDPQRSLGWVDGPLDGLSCLLRCVESAVRAEGLDQLEVARALAVPLDLRGGRRAPGEFHGSRLDWRNAIDGHEHWDEFTALVGSGTACVLMPDRYYWPGDEFEGKEHFLDHMVLAVGFDGEVLEVLDTDAPAADSYRRRLPVTAQLISSCCRWCTVHLDAVAPDPAELRRSLLEPTAAALAEDLPSVRAFGLRWRRDGLTGPAARALHILVLGEVQPALFLTGVAIEPDFPQAAAALLAASKVAQRLGKGLIAAHRYAGADARDRSVYTPLIGLYDALEAALTSLSETLQTLLGQGAPAEVTDDDAIWERIVRNQAWCYADHVASAGRDATSGDPR